MSRLLTAFAFLLSTGLVAIEAETKAPPLVKNLGGCFSVNYRFVEDGKHDYEIPNKQVPVVYEWITVKDNDKGAHVVQHYGVYQGDETGKFATMVHFQEHWSTDGKVWEQKVQSPSGAPRYTCTSAVRFGQLHCSSAKAPKPQRDTKRKDYDYLNRTQTIQSTPAGFVQSEQNDKVKKDGTIVATEVGWIEYRRLAGEKAKVCDDAKKEFP